MYRILCDIILYIVLVHGVAWVHMHCSLFKSMAWRNVVRQQNAHAQPVEYTYVRNGMAVFSCPDPSLWVPDNLTYFGDIYHVLHMVHV